MQTAEFNTTELNLLLIEIRKGNREARNQLVHHMHERLERLARRMLRSFPGVVRWEETQDVLQNSYMRLLNALESESPASIASLFALASELIRRELIDLARHYQGPRGLGANYRSGIINPNAPNDSGGGIEPAAKDPASEELDRWREFHECVESLPAEQREVFGLVYYHGWTRQQIAELFQRNERTISRHWRSACAALKRKLGGKWEDPK